VIKHVSKAGNNNRKSPDRDQTEAVEGQRGRAYMRKQRKKNRQCPSGESSDILFINEEVQKCTDYRRAGWQENRCAADPLPGPPDHPWVLRGREGWGRSVGREEKSLAH